MSTITFRLNGKPAQATTGDTVADLLVQQRIDPSHVVVEINRTIVNREQYGTTVINREDVIEVLRFVGGG